MHETKDQENPPDFRAQYLQGTLRVLGNAAVFQGERDISDVDEVKTDDEQVVYRIGELLIPAKAIDEKNPTILMESPGDPNGKPDADREVGKVSPDCSIHIFPFYVTGVSVIKELL